MAAKVLTSGDHDGATYVLTGPEALTYKDVAARISAVFARQVDYQDQPPKQTRELLLGSGLSHWNADGTLELFEWIRHGGEATVTADVRKVTGADPRPVQDWLGKERASFLDPSPDLPPSAFLPARPPVCAYDRSPGQIRRSRPSQNGARSVRLSTFPLGLRGSVSMTSTVRGHL